MATSEAMTPSGLPYGERKNVKEGRRRAGLPTGDAPSGPQPGPGGDGARRFIEGTRPAPTRPARGDFDPLLEAGPDAFGFLAEGQPLPQPVAEGPPDQVTAFARLAATAQSGFARAIAARLAERQGG